MAFYQCEKCKLTWQYPIDICPYCFEGLKDKTGKEARVISVSKVTLSTLFHPNAPYCILLLRDENGNTWAQKSSKELEVGSVYAPEPALGQDAVAIWKIKYEPLEAIKKAVALIGGVKLDQSSKVLILPTASAPTHYYFRDNTSPEFFEAALKFLLESGVKVENINVGAQSFDEMPIGAIAQKSGLLKICQKYGIMPADLAALPFEKVGHGGKYEMSKTALEADFILNLPILKMGQAQATQNLFRVLKKENYLGLKYLESETAIAESFLELKDKIITIADGENTQRSNKLTAFTGVVLAGRSAMNVDRVFNEITKANRLPELVKDIKVENIPLAGRSILETQYQAEFF
jgi:uncharacterized protein (DUF362 family)